MQAEASEGLQVCRLFAWDSTLKFRYWTNTQRFPHILLLYSPSRSPRSIVVNLRSLGLPVAKHLLISADSPAANFVDLYMFCLDTTPCESRHWRKRILSVL